MERARLRKRLGERRTDNGRQRRSQLLGLLAVLFLVWLVTCWPCSSGAAVGPTDQATARAVLKAVGLDRGLLVVVSRQPLLGVSLATEQPRLLVHQIVLDAGAAEQARRAARKEGLGIRRLAVEVRPAERIPEADNLADGIVLDGTLEVEQRERLVADALRAVRPQGVVLVSTANAGPEAVAAWQKAAKAAGAEKAETVDVDGQGFLRLVKARLAGAGQWSHWEHGPDNNPLSEDQVVRAPYLTQFLAEPLYIGMPAVTVAAGGRTFLAIGHIAHHPREWDTLQWLIARNGYNGKILWKRKLPDGYLVHRSAFIATPQLFYMIDGDGCLLLDPQTGEERGRVTVPGVEGQWKWMALKGRVLYVLAGPPDPPAQPMHGNREFGGWSWADMSPGYYAQPHVPWGFGNVLAAYDLDKKKTLWTHSVDEGLIDSRAMAIGEDRVFFYCVNRFLRCVDRFTGKEIWTNRERRTIELIEQPGRGLISTPGFRTACMTVFTPHAIVIQGQTRMNVVAVSPEDGYLLWFKRKVTNNPNALYVDGHLVLGIGPGGDHVVVDPVSGEVVENLHFRKRACTRLTGCPDSLFVRGEGLLRYDRRKKKVFIDGAARPGCNDGAIAANGLLYLGPWQCDCNLSLIGAVAKCSAGEFRIDRLGARQDRVEQLGSPNEPVRPLEVTPEDWPTYRANVARSASSSVRVRPGLRLAWQWTPPTRFAPTPPTAAGGLVFVGGDDGRVRALKAADGAVEWEYETWSPIKMPPTIWDGRALFGAGDGYVYCLEAATGRPLWRFQAAPTDRHIFFYGTLSSTWPVHTGVLVKDGVAYFAAGIIDSDGTAVYAIDARTGQVKWQNLSCGYLNEELRKGVSAQGNLTVHEQTLLLAGGNQVSPAPFSLDTGRCLAGPIRQGQPKANNGCFVGVLWGQYVVQGGRLFHSAPEAVATKGFFDVYVNGRKVTLNYGGVPPVWDDQHLVLVNFRHGKLTCLSTDAVRRALENWTPNRRRRRPAAQRFALVQALQRVHSTLWQTDLGGPNQFEVVSLALCPNAVVAVVQQQLLIRARPQWFLTLVNPQNGSLMQRVELPGEPLPEGLLVDRDGRVVVVLTDGRVLCFVSAGPAPARRLRSSAPRGGRR